MRQVLVTGGGGYVGAVLVPKLLARGYGVTVLDLFLFGERVLAPHAAHPGLRLIRGDIREPAVVRGAVQGCDAVIHLACISNDPSFELDPSLGRSINYDAFEPLVTVSQESGVRRFIYASTASVYGVSDVENVTEDHPLVPLTDYNRYKGLCEPILLRHRSPGFTPVVVRPATICGYSPRMRLDLTVNLLTCGAVLSGRITVFGGSQKRPNIHIDDITDLYCDLLEISDAKIAGKTFNAGFQNRTVADIAEMVREIVAQEVPGRRNVEIVTTPSNDLRSYHISSEKIKRELEFEPKRMLEDAVLEVSRALLDGRIPEPLADVRYYNVKALMAARLR